MAPKKQTKKSSAATKQPPAKKKTATKAKHASKSSRDKQVPVAQRILNNCAVLEARQGGNPNVSREQVAALCGYPKENGKGYVNALTILKKQKGYITIVDKQTMALTDAGREKADKVASVGSNQEQLKQTKERVKPKKARAIMDLLADGEKHSRKDIAKDIDVDINAKGFKNILSGLKSEEILEYCKDDNNEPALIMCDWLFPFGRGA